MKREFLQNLKVGEEALPKEVIDAVFIRLGKKWEDFWERPCYDGIVQKEVIG